MDKPVDSIPTTNDNATSPVTANVTEVIAGNELTLEEQRDRLHLERVIESI